MAVEPIWTVQELSNISGALQNLEEFLQEWEQDYAIKATDLMLNLDTMGRGTKRIGLVSFANINDTTLQFEAIDAEIGLI